MPSSRAILADITDLKLDPKKAHSAGKNGHLKQDVVKPGKKQAKVQEQPVVDVVPEVTVPEVVKPVVEPISEKQEAVDVDDKLQKPVKTGKKKKDEDNEAVS